MLNFGTFLPECLFGINIICTFGSKKKQHMMIANITKGLKINKSSKDLSKEPKDLMAPVDTANLVKSEAVVAQPIIMPFIEKGDYLTFSTLDEPDFVLIYYGEFTESKQVSDDEPETFHLENNINYAYAILDLKKDILHIRGESMPNIPVEIPEQIWLNRHRLKKADWKLENQLNHKLKEHKLRYDRHEKKLLSGDYIFEQDDYVVYAPKLQFGIKKSDYFITRVRECDYRHKNFSIANAAVYIESGKVELNEEKREIDTKPKDFRIASEDERQKFIDTLKENNITSRGWQYIDLNNQLNDFRLGDVIDIDGYVTIPAERPVTGSKCFKVYAWGSPGNCHPMIVFDKKCAVLDLIIDTEKEIRIMKPSREELDKFHEMLKKYRFPMNLLQRKLQRKRKLYRVIYSNKTDQFIVKSIPETKKTVQLKDVFEIEHLAYTRCEEYNTMLNQKRNNSLPEDKSIALAAAANQQAIMQPAHFSNWDL